MKQIKIVTKNSIKIYHSFLFLLLIYALWKMISLSCSLHNYRELKLTIAVSQNFT